MQQHLPDITIGCDILVGFPGESDAAAANTYQLLTDLPIRYLHIFPYSRREGTPAALFPEQISRERIQARTRSLHQLDAAKRQDWQRQALGSVHRVLLERKPQKDGLLQGLTENYLPVLCSGIVAHLNTIATVHLERMEQGQLVGRILAGGS